MHGNLIKMASVCLVAGLVGCSGSGDDAEDKANGDSAMATDAGQPYVLDVTMNRIDGTAQPLDAYEGKVLLVVNVASQCGLTPQYEGLEALYREKHDQGLEILGFPANDFGSQEPGTNEEIAQFCTGKYDVTFPMFEKITVKGEGKHELYQTLSQVGGEPSWNFTKYLVDRHGRVVKRFDPRTAPDDDALRAEVDRLLQAG